MKYKAPLLILALVILFFVLAPWGLYGLGLLNISGRPVAPVNTTLDPKIAENIWHKSGEKGVIRVESLSPYSYITSFTENDSLKEGSHIAWFVARNFNSNNLKSHRMIWWHLSGAAMTIWLSRNWTVEQLLAKAFEIQAHQEQNQSMK